MSTRYHIGADGCRAGWFVVALEPAGRFRLGCYPTVGAMWHDHRDAGPILIDIPIGLVSQGVSGRAVDALARKMLVPRRHGSVFSPPCRPALAARTYAEACRINQKVCGRKISIQTWHIAAKIKEIDDFLQATPAARGILRETHPEICFWALAGGRPMRHSKKTAAGQNERLDVLRGIDPRAGRIFKASRERFPRREVACDDILDALANAVSASGLAAAGATLPETPPRDRRGLPMEMVYWRPAFPSV